MRVLIVRLGAFGDIVHTLPLAADLSAGGWTVDWLCEDRWRVLLDGNPAVATVHELPRGRWRRSGADGRTRLRDLRRLRRRLRACRYDAIIDGQGLAKSALLAAAARGSAVIGHRRPRARELSRLLHRPAVPATATHVIDQQRALGLPLLRRRPAGGWRFPLPAWTAARSWAASWLDEQGLAPGWALNVGAGWPTKVWPLARQHELAELLAERHQRLLLLWGSQAERRAAEAVHESCPSSVLAPETDLPRLAGLLAASRLVVSGDTGPLHLAFALGTPCVGLFGPVPASRNGPRGPGSACLQAPGRAWERHDVDRGAMAAIGADAVLALGDQLLDETPT